jgi:hypothetical protein
VEELRKTKKTLRIAGLRVETGIWDFQNTKQEC